MASHLTRRGEGRQQGGALGRWEPFRGLRDLDPFSLMREMLRFDPFASFEQGSAPEVAFMPRTDVREKVDAYEIVADLPGVKQEDLDVSFTGNTLTISGEVQDEEREDTERYHAWERTYGHFSRSFTLPESADVDKVKAELRDGVLCVKIPKKAGTQPKRIAVEAGKGGEQPQQAQAASQGKQAQEGQAREPQEKQVKVEKKAA